MCAESQADQTPASNLPFSSITLILTHNNNS